MSQIEKKSENRLPVAVITGAGAGIGQALSYELATRGYHVYATVRDLKRAIGDYKASAVRGKPAPIAHGKGQITLLAMDITDKSAIARAAATILQKESRIELLVNNAGYGLYGPFEEIDEDAWRKVMETNFFGQLWVSRAFLPSMRSHRSGKILNITSILGQIVIPTGTPYCASKWALEAFSEALRYELAPFGVTVTAIEPGLIRTNFKKNTNFRTSSERESEWSFLDDMMLSQDYNSLSPTAEAAAKRIANIASRRRPATRYRIGLDAHFYYLIRTILPDFMVDLIMRHAVLKAWRKSEST